MTIRIEVGCYAQNSLIQIPKISPLFGKFAPIYFGLGYFFDFFYFFGLVSLSLHFPLIFLYFPYLSFIFHRFFLVFLIFTLFCLHFPHFPLVFPSSFHWLFCFSIGFASFRHNFIGLIAFSLFLCVFLR